RAVGDGFAAPRHHVPHSRTYGEALMWRDAHATSSELRRAVELVGLADLDGGNLLAVVGEELGEDLVAGVGLDVDADDVGGAGELGGFGGDELGGQVAGLDGELLHLVGERAVDEDGAQVFDAAGGGPDGVGRAG